MVTQKEIVNINTSTLLLHRCSICKRVITKMVNYMMLFTATRQNCNFCGGKNTLILIKKVEIQTLKVDANNATNRN